MALQSTYSSDQLQPRPQSPLCVVFMRLRISELPQCPITHDLGHEAA